MRKLHLLFTKDGLQWQISKEKKILEEEFHFPEEDSFLNFVEDRLETVLNEKKFEEIEIFSAINHFALMPENFKNHDLGYDLVSYNSNTNPETEELMLSINKKFGVQFYYTFPKYFYQRIKSMELPTRFNFSGEKFLNSISVRKNKEIHINLYHHQVEFLAFEGKKLLLYNNLDANSEVDFLYFIMFTLSKINFGTEETYFYVYGETAENDTFLSELRKFVKHLNIVTENKANNHLIMN